MNGRRSASPRPIPAAEPASGRRPPAPERPPGRRTPPAPDATPRRRPPASRRRSGSGRPPGGAERYRIAPGIAHRDVAGQTLLLGPGVGTLYTLNATGQLVWRRLRRRAPVPAIVEAVRRAFGIPPARATRDVRRFLVGLEARGFVLRG